MANNNQIINHYSELINKYGYNDKGMGWRTGKLLKRYNIFTKNLKFKRKNILDYGCGIGSFYNFLKKKKILVKKYYAIEINPLIINFIKKKYKKKIIIIDGNNLNKIKNIDISISNGVHNYNVKNIQKKFINDLNFLIKISKEAVGISFINDNVDYKEKYLSYKKIITIINFIKKKKLKFIIDQTFNKYETFLFIFK